MRVILITHGKVNPNGHNGISRVVYNLNKYQKEKGINSEIWSVVDGIKQETDFKRDEFVTIKCFPRVSISGTRSLICNKIEKEKDNIDLVHFHMPWLLDKIAIAKVCKKNGIPYIVTGHSAYSASQKQTWKMKLGKKYELPFLNNAIAVHAITREEGFEFKKFGIKSKIFVIPNSIEDVTRDVEDTKSVNNKVIFSFMGELRPQKNLDGLIKAVSLLSSEEREKIEFRIAGPDSNGNMEKLKKLAKDYSVYENFKFLGGVFGKYRENFFRETDIYITPSLSEVISLSAIEAMAYGKPCVFTRQSDVSYFYNRNFFVMCENYYEDIARGIKEILERKSEWSTMAKNARKTYEECFCWESNICKFIKEYNQIINGKLGGM